MLISNRQLGSEDSAVNHTKGGGSLYSSTANI
uniref:Uncharacterized protein n=1 Tax=Anguilla anguilla TaxID=7936 RepID=A0A0E9RVT8_ANGAN